MPARKFIQMIEEPVYGKLERIARARGIGLQMLIRSIVIPEWLEEASSLTLTYTQALQLGAAAGEPSRRRMVARKAYFLTPKGRAGARDLRRMDSSGRRKDRGAAARRKRLRRWRGQRKKRP